MYKIHRKITQKFLGLKTLNFQSIVFTYTQTYKEIFRSALVYVPLILLLEMFHVHSSCTSNMKNIKGSIYPKQVSAVNARIEFESIKSNDNILNWLRMPNPEYIYLGIPFTPPSWWGLRGHKFFRRQEFLFW